MLLLYILVVFVFILSFTGFYNFFTAPRLKKRKNRKLKGPFVSILIPARNEESNIATILRSVLGQDYKNFEVIVCDDNSEDRTLEIIEEYKEQFGRLKVIKGKPLPEDWLGKNWACNQLAERAKGDLLLFVDADVELEPSALSSAVTLMQNKKAKMLSVFPLQKIRSFGEYLVVPLMDWLPLTLISFDMVYKSSSTRLSVAVGQFILIEKRTYNRFGGHEAVARVNPEDVAISRKVKGLGEKVVVAKSVDLVKCGMYPNFKEAFTGFSRFVYNALNLDPFMFVSYVTFIMIVFFAPLFLALFNPIYLLAYIPLAVQRFLLAIMSRHNVFFDMIFLPVHGVIAYVACWYSLYLTLNKKIVWKGRRIKFSDA